MDALQAALKKVFYTHLIIHRLFSVLKLYRVH